MRNLVILTEVTQKFFVPVTQCYSHKSSTTYIKIGNVSVDPVKDETSTQYIRRGKVSLSREKLKIHTLTRIFILFGVQLL